MKTILKIWAVITIIILVIISIKLLDLYVSMKYEVDEPRAMNKINQALIEREKYLQMLIYWLWTIGIYLFVNLSVIVRLLFKRS